MDINYKDMVASMELQLASLYEEKAKYGSGESMQSMIRSLEEQVVSFYSEREANPATSDELKAMVHNLEECVVALIDEKIDLEKKLTEVHQKIETTKLKAKVLGSAIFEATLFDSQEKTSAA